MWWQIIQWDFFYEADKIVRYKSPSSGGVQYNCQLLTGNYKCGGMKHVKKQIPVETRHSKQLRVEGSTSSELVIQCVFNKSSLCTCTHTNYGFQYANFGTVYAIELYLTRLQCQENWSDLKNHNLEICHQFKLNIHYVLHIVCKKIKLQSPNAVRPMMMRRTESLSFLKVLDIYNELFHKM